MKSYKLLSVKKKKKKHMLSLFQTLNLVILNFFYKHSHVFPSTKPVGLPHYITKHLYKSSLVVPVHNFLDLVVARKLGRKLESMTTMSVTTGGHQLEAPLIFVKVSNGPFKMFASWLM
jgi:hypothetical protein